MLKRISPLLFGTLTTGSMLCSLLMQGPAQAQEKRLNIVMLMTDDTGWNDFGAYSNGGAALGEPTPNDAEGKITGIAVGGIAGD